MAKRTHWVAGAIVSSVRNGVTGIIRRLLLPDIHSVARIMRSGATTKIAPERGLMELFVMAVISTRSHGRRAAPVTAEAVERRSPMVLDLADTEESTRPQWRVLQTRARQEKAIARTFEAAGIEHYLPLMSRVSYRGSRRSIVAEPLFSSYLFVFGTLEAAYFAVSTKRVANVIHVGNQPEFRNELMHIRSALDSGAELFPFRFLTAGRRARVRSGPFRDVEGLIETNPDRGRLILQVAALGRATSLEIDASLLEPLD